MTSLANETVRKRFLALNQQRLARTRAASRPRQQDVLDALPLLFHINYPALPGYISADTPSGISNYHYDDSALTAIKRLVKGVDDHLPSTKSDDIYSIFLMGSSGTIAHSSSSDFDVWLCHSPSLTADQRGLLHQKAAKIEKWAEKFGLEVHFFLMDADRFRQGQVEDLSSESSGTAQHHLLLDEFYRTGLLLVGRIPTWWLVPPDHESDYDAYVEHLTESGDLQADESINFGGMGHMPAEEFFGAAVWQLYKGVDSPHKSVLKIVLMEAYAYEFPEVEFLCLAFKRAIYTRDREINDVDPYIMLINRLTDYLEHSNGSARLNLVRRCFYFKINVPLTTIDFHPGEVWQQDLLLDLVTRWRWGDNELSELDSRETWNIKQIIREKKLLIDELRHSYFALSHFAREKAGLAKISQQDLTVLGRKLYAAFERKAGKVAIVNRGFNTDLHEPTVAFVQHSVQNKPTQWHITRGGALSEGSPDNDPIKRGSNAVELAVWGFFNRIIDTRTRYSLHTKISHLSSRELSEIISVLEGAYPRGYLPSVTIDDYVSEPRLLSVQLFINVDINPASVIANSRGSNISPANALKFDDIGENLVRSVYALFVTSWQEAFIFHFKGIEGLLECLCRYLQWTPLWKRTLPPRADVFCFAHGYGKQLAKSVRSLFNDVVSYYCDNAGFLEGLRYVMAVEKQYAFFYVDGSVLKHAYINSYESLLIELAQPHDTFSPVIIDHNTMNHDVLALIYQYNKPDVVQFYFQPSEGLLELYVLDEKGSLHYQTLPPSDPKLILTHYHDFLRSTLTRRAMMHIDDIGQEDWIEFFQIYSPSDAGLRFERRPLSYSPPKRYFNIQVIGDPNDYSAGFSIYCGDIEFSTLEHGEQVFIEVYEHVMKQRKSGQRYPIYITDIDIPPALLGAETIEQLQSVHYLLCKKKIEDKLNASLYVSQ